MSTTGVSLSSTSPVTLGGDINNMSIEDALLLVQMDRVKLCESQLQDQISGIRDRNAQMKALNDIKSELLVLKGKFPPDSKDDKPLYDVPDWDKALAAKVSDEWKAAGLDPSYIDKIYHGRIKKGEFEAAEQMIKGQIDNLSSSSQMDMVRLQSLNGKRSEAFETMTNMLKKAADNKSSVVANFR